MSTKEAYVKKMQSKLDEWSAEIDKLKAKADSADADAQLKYYEEIDNLREMQNEANTKLDELKGASGDAWEDLLIGINSAWDALGTSIKSAASHFR